MKFTTLTTVGLAVSSLFAAPAIAKTHGRYTDDTVTTIAAAQQSPYSDPESQRYLHRPIPRHAIPRVNRSLLTYVISGSGLFGLLDLGSGRFVPIGPGLPSDVGYGMVRGPAGSLLTLTFSGNLDAIDPFTGEARVIGPTGLGDCSSKASPCGLKSANVMGRLDATYYATDFAQNLYSIDPANGAATLIGFTGIQAVTFRPQSINPDGSQNVYGESLFAFQGKLYAFFATETIDPETGAVVSVPIPGALYEINRKTAQATMIAPTDPNITMIVNVDGTIYAFDAETSQVVTLDLVNGQTAPVSDYDPSLIIIGGATPAHPGKRGRVDLNTLIPANSPWYLQSADSVNNFGEITGVAISKSACSGGADAMAWVNNQGDCPVLHAFVAIPK